ncbi:hypothetical protein [Dyella sp.]|uniref:hypothetical protein n=1 Tax=Dyella sp. TaxID=1869338 RepID=UPI003F816DA6
MQADDIPCSQAHPIISRFAGSTIRGDQQQGDGTAALPFDRAAAGKAKNCRVELVEQ